MFEIIKNIGSVASAIVTVATCLVLLVKPLREKLLGVGLIKEGLKCLLRNEITRIYYKSYSICNIKQYEFENLTRLYRAYKSLGGNSFIDKIYNEIIDTWTVVG